MTAMKNFHDYYFGIPTSKRAAFAARCGTAETYLERLAGGFRKPSIRLARKIIAASNNRINYESFVEVWEKRNGPL